MILISYLPKFIDAFFITVFLTVASVIIGFFLSLSLAVLSTKAPKIIAKSIDSFTFFFRATPFLLQLYIIYFGISQFEWVQNNETLWFLFSNPTFCALLGLVLNNVGYSTEILKGAILNIDKSQLISAKAFGFSYWLTLKRIVLPQALIRSIPNYTNEVIFMLHATALVSTITITDITGLAREIYARHFIYYEVFSLAALLYIIITLILVGGFKILEKKYTYNKIR